MRSFKCCKNVFTRFPSIWRIRSRSVVRIGKYSTSSSRGQGEDITRIRNIGIMAHIDAGKTTTTERMLYYSGFSRHLGDVDDGDTVTDYMTEERERGITITSAAVTFNWNKHKINLIDTPGHVDFTVEVERALRVLDGAVAVMDASAGVEAQTLTVWRQANRYSIPRIVFLNKMDKYRASLEMSIKSIHKKLHVQTLLLNMPIGVEKSFVGVVDLLTMEKLIWDPEHSRDGSTYKVTPLSKSDSELYLSCVEARTNLIGQLAEIDNTMTELVLSDKNIDDISPTDIREAVRRVTLEGKAVAVLCGSSLKNKGVQPLLESVINYLPNPSEIKHNFLHYYQPNLCALVFKIIHDKHRGALTFLRIYSGILKSSAMVYNVNRNLSEKVTRLIQVNADMYKDIPHIGPGNIVCVSGFREACSGDTITGNEKEAKAAAAKYTKIHSQQLSEKLHTTSRSSTAYSEGMEEDQEEDEEDQDEVKEEWDKPVLAGLDIPPPVFFCSIEAESVSRQRQLDMALATLQREDPSLKVEVNEETGQTVIAGMGELHIDIIKSRLLNEYKVEAYLGPLQVAYREMVSQSCDYSEVLDVKLGERTHRVSMTLSLHPSTEKKSFHKVQPFKRIEEEDEELHLKWKLLKAINIGVEAGLRHGPILHSPVTNMEVQIHRFNMKGGTSLPMVTACATQCIMNALKKAECHLLEPIMQLEVHTDEDNLHSVLGDLAQRRSAVQDVLSNLDVKVVQTLTPLSELMGYSTTLRTITSGIATFTMELSHYEKLSPYEQNRAIQSVSGILPV